MEKAGFAARHRWDTRFWVLFVATSWLAVAMGFFEPVAQRYAGEAPYAAPPILQLHVFVYFGWLVLLTLQVGLVARGRTDLHRRVGIAGALLAVLVVATGFGAEVYSQRFWARTDPENVRFFTFPLYTVIVFGICAAFAIASRSNPPAHKRLMFMATTAIMGGPYQRWWGDGLDALTGTGPFNTWVHFYFAINLLVGLAALYDVVTRGTVHRVFKIGSPLLFAAQIAATMIWYSDWWPPFVRAALSIPAP